MGFLILLFVNFLSYDWEYEHNLLKVNSFALTSSMDEPKTAAYLLLVPPLFVWFFLMPFKMVINLILDQF